MFLRKSGKNHAKFVIVEENLAKTTQTLLFLKKIWQKSRKMHFYNGAAMIHFYPQDAKFMQNIMWKSLGRVWLVRTRTGFTRTVSAFGWDCTCSGSTRTCSACSGLEAGADRAVSLFHCETWREHRFWSQMITCIRFLVGFVVPYKVTMVTHTHFEECTCAHQVWHIFSQKCDFFTKMCSVSGVPFGWHEAVPCAPAVRFCSRSYQPNAKNVKRP